MNWFFYAVIELLSLLNRSLVHSSYLLHKSLSKLTFQRFPNDKVVAYKWNRHRRKPRRNQSFSLILFGDRIQLATRCRWRDEGEKSWKDLIIQMKCCFYYGLRSIFFIPSPPLKPTHLNSPSVCHMCIKGIKFEWAFLFIRRRWYRMR